MKERQRNREEERTPTARESQEIGNIEMATVEVIGLYLMEERDGEQESP